MIEEIKDNYLRTDKFAIKLINNNILVIDENSICIGDEKAVLNFKKEKDRVVLESGRFIAYIDVREAISYSTLEILNKNFNIKTKYGDNSYLATSLNSLISLNGIKKITIDNLDYLIIADDINEMVDSYRFIKPNEEKILIKDCSWNSLKNTYKQLVNELCCGKNIIKIEIDFITGKETADLLERFRFLTSIDQQSSVFNINKLSLYPVMINNQVAENMILGNNILLFLLMQKKARSAFQKFKLPSGSWFHLTLGSKHEKYLETNFLFSPILVKGGTIYFNENNYVIYPGINEYRNEKILIKQNIKNGAGIIQVICEQDITLLLPVIQYAKILGANPQYKNKGILFSLKSGTHMIKLSKIQYFTSGLAVLEKALSEYGDIEQKRLVQITLNSSIKKIDQIDKRIKGQWRKMLINYYKKK